MEVPSTCTGALLLFTLSLQKASCAADVRQDVCRPLLLGLRAAVDRCFDVLQNWVSIVTLAAPIIYRVRQVYPFAGSDVK